MTPLRFWFDPVSPFAYLAFERLPAALEGLGCSVEYRPILFAGLLKHWGQLGPAEIEPKRREALRARARQAVACATTRAACRRHLKLARR